MTREELIRELTKKHTKEYCEANSVYQVGELLEYVVCKVCLSRERLLLEKIGKPLRDVKDCVLNRDSEDWCMETELYTAIDEALAIIEKEGGE